jgi:hypothetical protein
MDERLVSLCSFCGQAAQPGFASQLDGSQICEQCASAMGEIVRNRISAYTDVGVQRAKEALEEWILLGVPIAIVAIAASMQPASLSSPWAPLLQLYGAMFLVWTLFYQVWKVIRKRQWMPGVLVPMAWLFCGAYVGWSLGLIGVIAGAALALSVWLAFRHLIKRTRLRDVFDRVVLPQRPH